ncbi:MAG: DUF885 domain-containing protein [Gammaproteobacteria bacterium]|nr:DUF885 domain-containing protein [Gammaproteobacteria bacterium]
MSHLHPAVRRTRRLPALALASLLLGGAAVAPARADAPDANAAWDASVTGFIGDYFAANPVAAVYAGRHEYDGKLPDLSEAALRHDVARIEAAQARIRAVDPQRLSPQRQREREYLLAALDVDLFWKKEAQWPRRNPAYYLGLVDPEIYLSKPYAPLESRMRAYIAYAREIPRAAAQIRANLRTPMPAPWIEYGVNAFGGFAQFYRNDVAAVFADVKDAALQQQLAEANAAAAKSMQELADWLTQERGRATQDFALGPQLFSRMVAATEQVDVPLARLQQIGQADMERNLAALRGVCAKYAPGQSLRECVDKANLQRPEGGAVAAARRQLPELRDFVAARDIVTIPGPEQALVEAAPPYNAQNFAYINTPGPYESKDVPGVYYIAPPDPRWSPEDQAKYVGGEGTLLSTSVHEVWPGHFLHFLHVNRNPSKVAQLFQSYAYTEGWAHYTEEMMRDQGLRQGSAEWHVGQLVSALRRNARYLSAIGLHTQGMTVAQSEQLFVDALADPGNARQQALRGTYDPAYLNYTLGKLMIMKLRDDWMAAHPKATLREFHDAFLSYSGPVPLVRRLMLGNDSPPL